MTEHLPPQSPRAIHLIRKQSDQAEANPADAIRSGPPQLPMTPTTTREAAYMRRRAELFSDAELATIKTVELKSSAPDTHLAEETLIIPTFNDEISAMPTATLAAVTVSDPQTEQEHTRSKNRFIYANTS